MSRIYLPGDVCRRSSDLPSFGIGDDPGPNDLERLPRCESTPGSKSISCFTLRSVFTQSTHAVLHSTFRAWVPLHRPACAGSGSELSTNG
jgi:hypothetical protein